jgi:hypothetical protein
MSLFATSSYAAFFGASTQPVKINQDVINIKRMIYEIGGLYIAQANFHNLNIMMMKPIVSQEPYAINDKDLGKFTLSTENKDTIAVIKYKVQNCNNVKDLIKEVENVSFVKYKNCQNNEFVIKFTHG